MTNEKYRLLWHAHGYMDAQILKNYLESFEIDVITYGESVGQAYGLTSTPLGEIELHVKESQFEMAENILEDYFSKSKLSGIE